MQQVYNHKRSHWVLTFAIAAISLFITAGGTAYLTMQKGALDEFFHHYKRINIVVIATCIFLWAKSMQLEFSPKAAKLIQTVSDRTFFIYLIHPIFAFGIIEIFDLKTLAEYHVIYILTSTLLVF